MGDKRDIALRLLDVVCLSLSLHFIQYFVRMYFYVCLHVLRSVHAYLEGKCMLVDGEPLRNALHFIARSRLNREVYTQLSALVHS